MLKFFQSSTQVRTRQPDRTLRYELARFLAAKDRGGYTPDQLAAVEQVLARATIHRYTYPGLGHEVIVIAQSNVDIQAAPAFQVIGFNRQTLEFRHLFAHEVAAALRLSIGKDKHGGWVCRCGNRAELEGFYPCDRSGQYTEPTPEAWTREWYGCAGCGRIIDQTSEQIVGMMADHSLSPEEQQEIKGVSSI